MRGRYNTKGKIILFMAFSALSGALILGFVLHQRYFDWPVTLNSFDNISAQKRVLEFLDRAGWKPTSEKVIVEKVGDDLGLARAVLLKKLNDGVSSPGVLFLVGRRFILVGRLFDSQTGRDLSPDLFGRVPITFDVSRLNLASAHRRGSENPKVVIVEYGDYGCQSCAKLEKVWQTLLDNFPDVQHVYKHFPMSEGSRYLAEIAEAVGLHDESRFWFIWIGLAAMLSPVVSQAQIEFFQTPAEQKSSNPKKSPAIAPGSKLAKVLFFIAPGCSACPDEAAKLEIELRRMGLKYQIEGVFVGDPLQVGKYLAAMRAYPFKFDLALDVDGKLTRRHSVKSFPSAVVYVDGREFIISKASELEAKLK